MESESTSLLPFTLKRPTTAVVFFYAFISVLVVLTITLLVITNNQSIYTRSDDKALDSENTCGRYPGLRVDSDGGLSVTPDCNALCHNPRPDLYRSLVAIDEDYFLDGVRIPRPGTYCISKDTCVTRCNTKTSRLVVGTNGRFSCLPMWPAVFGGADGSDILVCGGKLTDGIEKYEYRLPPSGRLNSVVDPYAETERFLCTPGEYVDGPKDYMNNRYIQIPNNRFRRMRNNCAKYVANAYGIIKPVTGGDLELCNCLSTHGPIRRFRTNNDKLTTDANPMVPEQNVLPAVTFESSPEVFRVPYACSPCVAGGGLVSTDGVINVPTRCIKYNQRYFYNLAISDLMPCGTETFSHASHAPCSNTRVLVGDKGVSYALKKALRFA